MMDTPVVSLAPVIGSAADAAGAPSLSDPDADFSRFEDFRLCQRASREPMYSMSADKKMPAMTRAEVVASYSSVPIHSLLNIKYACV